MENEGKNRREHPRMSLNLLVKVKYESVKEFVDHYSINISKGGMFLRSRNPHPAGTLLRFEVKLKSGETVLSGKGKVAWSRSPSAPGDSSKTPGMGLKFLELDVASKAMLSRILEAKAKTKQGTDRDEELLSPPVQQPERSSGIDPLVNDTDIGLGIEPQAPATADRERVQHSRGARATEQPTVLVAAELTTETPEAADGDFEVDISVDDLAEHPSEEEPAGGARMPPTGGISSRIIGIDLGTTYSCAAVVMDGKPHVIPSRKGYRTIPSVVAYTNEGRLLVGHDAKAQMELNPKNTVYGSKRLVGRPFSSPAVRQMKDRFHYEIIEGPKHEAAVRIVGREFSLQQVAAFVLSEIRDIARDLLKEEVNRAVITVPAYFNENQRQAVREAGILAGLHVERIVNEPTAAALAYGYNRGLDQRLLVYDLGGGTFDASVLELCDNVYEVVSTGGDTFLGGVDFDNQLVDCLLDAFCRQIGKVPQLDRSAMQRLRDASEQAKCALSEKEETIVRLPFFSAVDNVPKDLELPISRALLEELVAPLVERTLVVAMNVLDRAKVEPGQLDNILLVGGQSRMPMIWRRIREVFGKDPHKGVHPDEAVAIGAALLADSLGKIDSVVLIDVLPVSIGIGIPGGRFMKVLEAGTTLPTTKNYTIRTYKDDQETMELTVLQGESDRVVDNEYLGTAIISGITRASKGAVQLEITFTLDQECLLQVSSREVGTGRVTVTQMKAKDTAETIRKKLQIPEYEVSSKEIGVPESLRKKEAIQPVEQKEPKKAGGILTKLFGRRKSAN